jgi:transcriptional regulator with PAS, ATPase and Fis domain
LALIIHENFTRLLALKKMGLLVFDRQFRILQIDRYGEKMIRSIGEPPVADSLLSVFPEFIGSEEDIQKVLLGKKKDYRLDYVNRVDEAGITRYVHLLVLRHIESEVGLLVIEDVSEKGLAVQLANQQRYEWFLLKRDDEHRKKRLVESIIGKSPAIKAVRHMVQKLRSAPKATVLIVGETGTGKSHTARVIHESTTRAEIPFVEINCAALPHHLIESELFGYEKGAFTHAIAAKPGLLEEARGGTIFLDEIGELPLSVQSKLLAALETKRFRRLGSTTLNEVNARFIAATNRDLQKAVEDKTFREDLYYRLNVVSLTLPPLRTMGSDILLLADHFIKMFNVELKKSVKGLDPQARQVLLNHAWLGNVRELSNCLERAMIFIETEYIQATDLALFERDSSPHQKWTVPPGGIVLDEVERNLISSALNRTNNNKSKAARLLGLSRDTLRYRMEKYGL